MYKQTPTSASTTPLRLFSFHTRPSVTLISNFLPGMATIEPYTISVVDSQIKRLKQKLELTTFPDELDGASWDYGAPLADVKRITTYWKDKYDWRKNEAVLNDLPNYKANIQVDGGFDPIEIHFIHHKSKVKGAIPLLFVHGCMPLIIKFSLL